MPDPQSQNKQLFVPAHGSDVDSWDIPVNFNWNQLDAALGKYTTLNANGLSGTIALTTSMTAPLGFIVTGTPAGSINYQTPAGVGGLWLVRNNATLGASITIGFSSASGGSTVTIPAGKNLAISADGTSNGMADIDTVPTSVAGGSPGQIQVNVAGVLGGYAGFTFDGSTFHTPELTVDGNAVFGTGAGSTMTVNGTAISAPNGFNFNAGAFEMNAGGMLGIGTAPTSALLTVGGLVSITSGGVKFPDSTTQTSATLTSMTNSLAADVNLSSTGNYFTGPTVAQGPSGTWLAVGQVTLRDSAVGNAQMNVKLWDGTTVIASTSFNSPNNNNSPFTVALSGVITSPAGNIRISVQDATSATGLILANYSGNAKDSILTVVKIGP